MRFQYAPLKSKPTIFQPTNPCPVCGAETALAEIAPHPLHVNFEIHGYLCDRCGPIKSLVVLRSPTLQPMM
jgi:C4-type Zn-finger protein